MSIADAPAARSTARPVPGPRASSPADSGPERRHPLLITLIVVAMIAALLASVARGFYRDGPLEPDAPTGQGSRAVVQVLGDLGVEVDVDRHTADAADALREGRTVLVTAPGELNADQLTALAEARDAHGARLVLVRPDFVALSYLTSGISPSGALRDGGRLEAGPECGDLAHQARLVDLPTAEDGLFGAASLYRTSDGARSCFEADNGALVAEHDGVLVLGSADLLTNDGIGRADNSALVLNLLAADGELSWYVPSANDPMGTTSLTPLGYLPDWAGPLLLWVVLVAVIALVAVGRRFGPVVLEPLPVTVRPQELVLGRAQLLQRADARDDAARALRTAASTRLADRLGLRHESSLEGLLAALRPHADRSEEQLRALLGPTPVTSDQDLVRLAHELDRLEKEIDR
ncbi:hypothetical protein CFK38_08600 [Brachybacterium vulturis]|uniref:DUF4350 domain-containing protein n=1 Tax=Brachybacterium vulturis TaxID=2017484 RepID=A0A291GMX1_9MICO|nr:DUF4350 domain-containing protein [Brachybacterium vulturis]ATG51575.1 hypothetical protein CFK38_08600 [Brachybacterium vulturis]